MNFPHIKSGIGEMRPAVKYAIIFLLLVLIVLLLRQLHRSDSVWEHASSVAAPASTANATEALQNIASMYNSGTLTATNIAATGTATVANLIVSGTLQMGTNTLQTISDGSLVIYPTKLANGQPGTSANTLLQITPSGIIATPNGFITSNASPTAMIPDIGAYTHAGTTRNNNAPTGFTAAQFGKYALSNSSSIPLSIPPPNNTIAIYGYGVNNMAQIVKGGTAISALPKNPSNSLDLDPSYNNPKFVTYLTSPGTDFDALTGQKDSTGLFDTGRFVKTFM